MTLHVFERVLNKRSHPLVVVDRRKNMARYSLHNHAALCSMFAHGGARCHIFLMTGVSRTPSRLDSLLRVSSRLACPTRLTLICHLAFHGDSRNTL